MQVRFRFSMAANGAQQSLATVQSNDGFCPRLWKNALCEAALRGPGRHGRGAGRLISACGLSEAIRF
jgi:hypothetical protein